MTLAGAPGKQAYDAALAGQLAAVRRGRTSGLGGAFGRALGNLSLPDDYATALATLTTYATFERDDRTLRADVAAGNVAEAVRFDTSSAAKDAGGDFNAFTAAVDRWIHLHQQAFDQAIRDGSGILSSWQWYRFAAVAVFVLPLLGALPRLVEFGLPGLREGG